jgi:hypothetical protein
MDPLTGGGVGGIGGGVGAHGGGVGACGGGVAEMRSLRWLLLLSAGEIWRLNGEVSRAGGGERREEKLFPMLLIALPIGCIDVDARMELGGCCSFVTAVEEAFEAAALSEDAAFRSATGDFGRGVGDSGRIKVGVSGGSGSDFDVGGGEVRFGDGGGVGCLFSVCALGLVVVVVGLEGSRETSVFSLPLPVPLLSFFRIARSSPSLLELFVSEIVDFAVFLPELGDFLLMQLPMFASEAAGVVVNFA